jgi:hypothetical protein
VFKLKDMFDDPNSSALGLGCVMNASRDAHQTVIFMCVDACRGQSATVNSPCVCNDHVLIFARLSLTNLYGRQMTLPQLFDIFGLKD